MSHSLEEYLEAVKANKTFEVWSREDVVRDIEDWIAESPVSETEHFLDQLCAEPWLFGRIKKLIEGNWPQLQVVKIPVHEEGVHNYIITPREL